MGTRRRVAAVIKSIDPRLSEILMELDAAANCNDDKMNALTTIVAIRIEETWDAYRAYSNGAIPAQQIMDMWGEE